MTPARRDEAWPLLDRRPNRSRAKPFSTRSRPIQTRLTGRALGMGGDAIFACPAIPYHFAAGRVDLVTAPRHRADVRSAGGTARCNRRRFEHAVPCPRPELCCRRRGAHPQGGARHRGVVAGRRAAAEPAPSGKPGTDARSAENGGEKLVKSIQTFCLSFVPRAICESGTAPAEAFSRRTILFRPPRRNSMDRPRDRPRPPPLPAIPTRSSSRSRAARRATCRRHCRAVRVDHGAHGPQPSRRSRRSIAISLASATISPTIAQGVTMFARQARADRSPR